MFKVMRAEQGKVTILRFIGEVNDASAHDTIRAVIQACLREGKFNLVVNLKSVVFIDNLGIAAIMESLGHIRTLKGDIKLAEISIQGSRLLRMMGLVRVFDIYEVESAAIRGYQREAA